MNWTQDMMPGVTLLAVGGFLAFFAENVCTKRKNAQGMRMLGTALAVIGAVLVFTA